MLWRRLVGAKIDLPVSVVYRGAVSATSDATTHTFSSVNFGVDAQNRYLVFLVTYTRTSYATAATLTVNGIAATKHVFRNNAGGDNITATAIYSVKVEGTSGTVVSTNVSAGGSHRVVIGVYSMYNANSNTPVATNTARATSGSVSVSGAAGGAIFAVSGQRGSGAVNFRGAGAFNLTNTAGTYTVNYTRSDTTSLSGAVTQNYNLQTTTTGSSDPTVVCVATFV